MLFFGAVLYELYNALNDRMKNFSGYLSVFSIILVVYIGYMINFNLIITKGLAITSVVLFAWSVVSVQAIKRIQSIHFCNMGKYALHLYIWGFPTKVAIVLLNKIFNQKIDYTNNVFSKLYL